MKDLREDLLEKMLAYKIQYKNVSLEHWATAEFGLWTWWLSLILVFLPLYIGWKFLDKKRVVEIAFFGLLVMIISSYLDVLGSEFIWWEYPVLLIPNLPLIFPIDFAVIPVIFMFIYQYFPKWKGFILVNVSISVVFSFVMEPLMIWMNLYRLVSWKLYYSFPIYILMAIFCKFIVHLALKEEEKIRRS